MYKKIAIALIVVGVLVAGYGMFTNSTAHASHCTIDGISPVANPELLKLNYCGDATVITAARESAAVVAANPELTEKENETTSSTFLAANPELMVASRYAAQVK